MPGKFLRTIEFFVPGVPRPGGSKRVFLNRKTGKPIVTDMSNNQGWKSAVRFAAAVAAQDGPLSGPLSLLITFYMPRPKSHFRSGKFAGQIKPTAPIYPTNMPDTTKLIRSTEDSLTGIVWSDDCLVAVQSACKLYGGRVGALIKVSELDPNG